MTTETDVELASRIARDVGQELLKLREARGVPRTGTEYWALKDAGDELAQGMIDEALRRARPSDAILSEEAFDDRVRLSSPRVWIVDPLDGTSDFGHGDPHFAVQIALWEQDRFTLGVLDLPDLDLHLSTEDPAGVHPIPSDRPVRLVVSLSRTPAGIAEVCSKLGRFLAEKGFSARGVEVVRVGSVGGKVAHILAGEADLYWNPGGLNEWDAAAPAAVAEARGLKVCHTDGAPLRFNQPDTLMHGVIYGLPSLVDALLDILHA